MPVGRAPKSYARASVQFWIDFTGIAVLTGFTGNLCMLASVQFQTVFTGIAIHTDFAGITVTGLTGTVSTSLQLIIIISTVLTR